MRSLVIYPVICVLACVLGTAAVADETNTVASTTAAAHQLLTEIMTRVQQDKTNQADYSDLFKESDALVSAHKGETNDALSQLLVLQLQVSLELLNDYPRARNIVRQSKELQPGSRLAGDGDKILALIDKRESAQKIQAQLIQGATFPVFEEKDLAGQVMGPAHHKGKILLIDFWATWCGPCVAEMPNVVKTYSRHHDAGFDVIGISLDEDKDKLQSFVKQKEIPWQQYFGGEGWDNKLVSRYGIDSIPASFLLDRNGVIIARNLRGEQLEAAVTKALEK